MNGKKIVCPNCLNEFSTDEKESDKKSEIIRIRCRKSTYESFRRYAKAYSTLEDALLSLIAQTIDMNIR